MEAGETRRGTKNVFGVRKGGDWRRGVNREPFLVQLEKGGSVYVTLAWLIATHEDLMTTACPSPLLFEYMYITVYLVSVTVIF